MSDGLYLQQIWNNLDKFLTGCSAKFANETKEYNLLEIGASDIHKTAKDYFPENVKIKTLDIVDYNNPDYVGDICKKNESIPDDTFDFVCICEVLEHCHSPWNAPDELKRIIKPGGYAFISTPCNLYIHPPFPDYWRFTHYGLKELFKEFKIDSLEQIEDRQRPGFPIQYTMVAQVL